MRIVTFVLHHAVGSYITVNRHVSYKKNANYNRQTLAKLVYCLTIGIIACVFGDINFLLNLNCDILFEVIFNLPLEFWMFQLPTVCIPLHYHSRADRNKIFPKHTTLNQHTT